MHTGKYDVPRKSDVSLKINLQANSSRDDRDPKKELDETST